MKMIFPNMIEAVTLIFGVSRSIRGEIACENGDPMITELFAITALTDKLENGPVMVMTIEPSDPSPEYHRAIVIPDLLMEFDFVFHVADGIIYEAHDKEEIDLLKAHLYCNDIEVGDIRKESVFGTLYNKSEIMAQAIATKSEYVAFYLKNADKDFPDAHLPNHINALWRLLDPECVDNQQSKFQDAMAAKTETIDWN